MEEPELSLLNIGLQCGLLRAKMSDNFETAIKNCNYLQQLRQTWWLWKHCDVSLSLKPAVDLLNIFQRLELKGKAFEVYKAATKEGIEEFLSVLLLIDSTVTIDDTTKDKIKRYNVDSLSTAE